MQYKIIIAAFLCFFAGTCSAQTDYERIESKAERFFANEEWASANAMYLLMLDQKPHVTSTYAHSIVAYYMIGDTLQAVEMLPRALSFHVPADILLRDIRKVSFSQGRGDLYEDLLKRVQQTFPWFSRIADNYLMQYYAFRQNGPELIRYAVTMLEGLPDNRNFLRMLASGQILTGYTSEALKTWHRVVELYPDDYDTVLDIANCYDALGDKTATLTWMQRASDLLPTPYVTSKIAELRRTFK